MLVKSVHAEGGLGGGAHLQSDIRLGAVSLVGLVW